MDQALADRQRERAVLAEWLPRAVHAMNTMLEGEQASADADKVAAHLAEAAHSAALKVEAADTARAAAEQNAAAARTETEAARLERDAAVREASTSQKEAGAAYQAQKAALSALNSLTEEHLQLRTDHQALAKAHRELDGAHHDLVGRHEILSAQHTELTATYSALQEVHTRESSRAGRLEGELQALHRQLDTLSEQVRAEQQQFTEERHGHAQVVEALNQRLTTALTDNASLTERLASRSVAAEAADVPAAPSAVTIQPTDEIPSARGEERHPPSEGEATAVQGAWHADGGPAVEAAAIEDLGTSHGSGWVLVQYADDEVSWTVLRDGQAVGSVSPEHAPTGQQHLRGWSAVNDQMIRLRPAHGTYSPAKNSAASLVMADALRRQPNPAYAAPAWWLALTNSQATALVKASVPLATAAARGHRLASLSTACRGAALRLSIRSPRERDLGELLNVPAARLAGKDARRLDAVLSDTAAVLAATDDTRLPEPASDPGPGIPADLKDHDSGTWTLMPDPDQPDSHHVLADGTPVGALVPEKRAGKLTGKWSAMHRRHPLAPATGRLFEDTDTAIRAVVNAEAAYQPLPPLDDPRWDLPGWLKGNLCHAVLDAKNAPAHLKQLQPPTFSKVVLNALAKAQRTASGRTSAEHLAVLVDLPRQDLGPAKSPRADKVYTTLQEIRRFLVGDAAPRP